MSGPNWQQVAILVPRKCVLILFPSTSSLPPLIKVLFSIAPTAFCVNEFSQEIAYCINDEKFITSRRWNVAIGFEGNEAGAKYTSVHKNRGICSWHKALTSRFRAFSTFFLSGRHSPEPKSRKATGLPPFSNYSRTQCNQAAIRNLCS